MAKHRAYVERDGRLRGVKNLGWLLANWRTVERFTVTGGPHVECALDLDMGRACGCWGKGYLLTAHLRDGGAFRTEFASSDTIRHFLHRPKFIGVPVDFCGAETVC